MRQKAGGHQRGFTGNRNTGIFGYDSDQHRPLSPGDQQMSDCVVDPVHQLPGSVIVLRPLLYNAYVAG
jgi:hypothetical protein